MKEYFIGAIVGVTIVGVLFTKMSKESYTEIKSEEKSSLGSQTVSLAEESRNIIKIVDSEKKYQEEFKSEYYQIKIKNVSGNYISSANILINGMTYTLYDMDKDEEFYIVTFNEEDISQLKVLSVVYEINSLFEDEIDVEYKANERKVKRHNL